MPRSSCLALPGPRSPSCPRSPPPARPGAFARAGPSAPGVMTTKPRDHDPPTSLRGAVTRHLRSLTRPRGTRASLGRGTPHRWGGGRRIGGASLVGLLSRSCPQRDVGGPGLPHDAARPAGEEVEDEGKVRERGGLRPHGEEQGPRRASETGTHTCPEHGEERVQGNRLAEESATSLAAVASPSDADASR